MGLEFAGSYKPFETLIFLVNYSYISMDNPIIATPEQQLNMSGAYKWHDLSFNLSMQLVHNLYNRITPTKEKESYTLLNSRIAYTFNKYFDIFMKGENLTNTK